MKSRRADTKHVTAYFMSGGVNLRSRRPDLRPEPVALGQYMVSNTISLALSNVIEIVRKQGSYLT